MTQFFEVKNSSRETPRALRVMQFVDRMYDPLTGGFRSVPGGPVTLYGTCYATLLRAYADFDEAPISERALQLICECQDPATGLLIGPELQGYQPPAGLRHDREHLLLHLTCTAAPVLRHFSVGLPFPIRFAHRFCDEEYLTHWLGCRNLEDAWFEGNNLLFVGQLLVYLRDVEQLPSAAVALRLWFNWLDEHIDPLTGLWGTNRLCSPAAAVYGGYHQLLVYFHESHAITSPRELVDTVLSLQHWDGGFNPDGNGGACEDVDCVDILVNMYKRFDYRRAEIRAALRSCLDHILLLQNSDGGFPYNRKCAQSHMSVPGTEAGPDQSTMFATWFRFHTLALMAEILTDEIELQWPFRFTNNLSMGWHIPWDKRINALTARDRDAETSFQRQRIWRRVRGNCLRPAKRSVWLMRNLATRLRKVVSSEQSFGR